jgi:phospholipase C
MNPMLRDVTVLAVIAGLVQPAFAASPLVTTQPDPPADVAPHFVADTDPRWTSPEWSADDIAALRRKIKYVFVIFNENRSFDHEYGTLPGVNGLYSDGKNPRSPADTPGFTESYLDTNTGENGDRSALSRRSRTELDLQGLHRPFPSWPRSQD